MFSLCLLVGNWIKLLLFQFGHERLQNAPGGQRPVVSEQAWQLQSHGAPAAQRVGQGAGQGKEVRYMSAGSPFCWITAASQLSTSLQSNRSPFSLWWSSVQPTVGSNQLPSLWSSDGSSGCKVLIPVPAYRNVLSVYSASLIHSYDWVSV